MASTYLDMTAANALLKEYYDDAKVQWLVYHDNPTVAMMPKDEEAVGEYVVIPTIYAASQGAGAAFATAQSNQVALQAVKFLVPLKTSYSLSTIQNQAIEAAGSDKGSFLRLAKTHVEGAIRTEKNRVAAFAFRSGTGSLAQVNSSGLSTGVATLSNAADVVHFEVGMTCQANATDGGGSPRAALGYVIAVNRAGGTVTFSATQGGAAGTPSGWSASDYLLRQSDNNAVMSGISAWIPTTDPSSSDSFYGVNRSADVTRLSGVRYTGSSQTIEEALIDGSMLLGREGGSPDYATMPYLSYAALDKALGARRVNVTLEGPAGISFSGVEIIGLNGKIKVVPDRSCQAATCWLMQMDTWKLYSLGPCPKILRSPDGLDMLRVYNADAAEVRCGDYANIGNSAPGWNAYISLAI